MTTTAILPSGTAMSWEEFDALGEMRWTEYIDGRIVVPDNPDRIHQDAVIASADALHAALRPGFKVTHPWSWKPGRDEFVPDVMVHPRTREQVRYLGVPCPRRRGHVGGQVGQLGPRPDPEDGQVRGLRP